MSGANLENLVLLRAEGEGGDSSAHHGRPQKHVREQAPSSKLEPENAMHKIILLSIGCLFGALPASAANTDRVWAPGPAAIQKVETAIGPTVDFSGAKCPPQKLKDFARYYYGIIDTDGHPIIVGQLLLAKDWPGRKPGVHIDASGITKGNACSIANVWFDAETSELVYAFWG